MKSLSLIESAFLWAQHTRACGCHFDADRKAAEAVRFCLEEGTATFAVPSKLEGTARYQGTLLQLRKAHGWQLLTLEYDEASGLVLASWHGAPVGHLRPKHADWVLPLLATGRLRCYVLRVTGGPEYGKQHRGCNVVLAGLADSLTEHTRRSALAVMGDGRTGPAPVISERFFAYAA